MRNKSVRAAAGILALSMMLTLIPVNSVQASEDASLQQTDVEQTSSEIENALDYIYINEAELMSGDLQNIVVSWNDETVKNIELTLENDKGEVSVLAPTDSEDGIFLFQEYFETGVYRVTSVTVENEQAEQTFTTEELEVKAGFSVGVEDADIEKSEHLTMDSVTDEDVDTQIVMIKEDGTTEAVDDISEALENSGVGSSKARASKSEVVVVLDPGHDSKHAGAQGNGVKEEVATFKIATYCKAELETYEGVTVYMTREGAACPFPSSSSNVDDIAKRVNWAAGKGADVFVSIHLNAAEATGAKGAEVYYSKYSNKGKELSQKIQNELIKIGLYDRKIKDNDAYRVINASQQNGFPGIIIEHAFITNSSDANAYLKSEAGLKKLGVADATGIANYFGLKKVGTRCEMPEGVFTFTNKSAELSVDLLDGEPILESASQENTQRFKIVSAGNKYYYIKSVANGKALSIKNGKVCIEAFSENVTRQMWMFVENESGTYYLKTKSGSYLGVQKNADGSYQLIGSTATGKMMQWNINDGDNHLTPKLISAVQAKNSVTVKWNKVAGANGYYVYRKVKGEGWKRIATLKSGSTVSYTDESPIMGKSNIYTVRAYTGLILSGYDSNGVSAFALEKPVLESVTYGSGAMTLRWKEVAGVKEYHVYRKENGGKWQKIASVSYKKLYYKDSDVKDGTLYCYTVRATRESNSSDYYSGLKAIHLAAPKLSSVKCSGDNVTVKWNTVTGAQGYRVYRKEKGGSWKSIAKLTVGTKNSYVDRNTTKGKTYIYTVRAYYGNTQSNYDATGMSVTIPKVTYLKYKTVAKVNYRLGPGTGYDIAGTLASGTQILVVKGYSKKANGYTWYKVKINSKTYYMASSYLKKM